MADAIEVYSLTCTSCGAPIDLPSDIDTFNCAYCGAALMVRRGDGYVALQMAEKMTQAVEAAGAQTQSTIQEESAATRAQLKRLELQQALAMALAQLSGIQAEIRGLERQRRTTRRERRQLRELRDQERDLLSRIGQIRAALAPAPTEEQQETTGPQSAVARHRIKRTLLFVAFFLGGFLFLSFAFAVVGMHADICVSAAGLLALLAAVTISRKFAGRIEARPARSTRGRRGHRRHHRRRLRPLGLRPRALRPRALRPRALRPLRLIFGILTGVITLAVTLIPFVVTGLVAATTAIVALIRYIHEKSGGSRPHPPITPRGAAG